MKWLVFQHPEPTQGTLWFDGLVVLEQLKWLDGEVDLKVRNAPPSGLTLALFPLIPLLILKSISGASFSSFPDLSFSFIGNVNIQIATFIQDIKHEKLNKIPDKKQTFDAESCLQCRDSDSRKYGEPRINIGLMKKRTNSDCRFWVDLRRRWKEVIGQQKGHACKITHPDSVLVGSRVILVTPTFWSLFASSNGFPL